MVVLPKSRPESEKEGRAVCALPVTSDQESRLIAVTILDIASSDESRIWLKSYQRSREVRSTEVVIAISRGGLKGKVARLRKANKDALLISNISVPAPDKNAIFPRC